MKRYNLILKNFLILGAFIAVVVWLSVLTQKNSQHNQALIALNHRLASNETNINYQRVNETLTELSKQINIEQDKNSEMVKQSQLSEVQDELRSRIQLVSEQFGGTVSYKQLQILQQDINRQVETVNEKLVQLFAKIEKKQNEVPNAPTTVTASSSNMLNTTAQNAPFVIQSKELRAGEWMISVRPVKQQNIESSVLLTIGQSFGSWQLLAIEEHHALFKVGKLKHRLAIPN